MTTFTFSKISQRSRNKLWFWVMKEIFTQAAYNHMTWQALNQFDSCPLETLLLWLHERKLSVVVLLRPFGRTVRLAHFYRPFGPCTNIARAQFVSLEVSQTCFRCVLDSARAALCHDSVHSVHSFLWTENLFMNRIPAAPRALGRKEGICHSC